MNHDLFMHRCIELAQKGAGYVAPNPMVGAVLVHDGVIIGEGYHPQYGGPHAEVNCIASVTEANKPLITASTMYVSLEPCAHFGKTPPCADLIIANKIKKVVIGCRDPFTEVNGKGIEKLQAAGIEVMTGVAENECKELNRRFFTFHTKQRPYIILKWAQTADKKIAAAKSERLFITNEYTDKLVHKWRSEEAGILIGTNTALADNPMLTTRKWNGASPIRLVLDMRLRLPETLHVFDKRTPAIIFNTVKQEETLNLSYCLLKNDAKLVPQLCNALYKRNIQSVIVEGGAKLLQSFIDENIWDEANVITNTGLTAEDGLAAPVLANEKKVNELLFKTDKIEQYKHIQL